MTTKIISYSLPIPADFTITTYRAAVDLLKDRYKDEPVILMVSPPDYFHAEEVAKGGDISILVMDGFRSGHWCVTGKKANIWGWG